MFFGRKLYQLGTCSLTDTLMDEAGRVKVKEDFSLHMAKCRIQ